MAKASTTELFNCTPDQFYKIVTDYAKYPEFLSEVKKCEVLKTETVKSDASGVAQQRKLVEYSVSVVKSFKYQIWTTETPHLVSWEFASGDLFKTMKGSWKIEDEAGRTRATYTVEASFGIFVPSPISNALMSVNLPNMISSYHKRIKHLYGI